MRYFHAVAEEEDLTMAAERLVWDASRDDAQVLHALGTDLAREVVPEEPPEPPRGRV